MTKHSQGRVRLRDADDRAVVYELINRPMTDPTEAAKLVPFCLNCHDGDGDTPFSAGRTPPYVRENLWNVAAHKTGGDYGTPLTCMGDGESFGCHATGHGSENIKLLNADSADSLVEFCYNCHTSTSIWNTMCNNCHYYYGGHHAGMSCGSASCHEANSVHRIIHVTHSYTKYLWTPAGVPEIVEVEGAAGSHILEVTFSEAVYSHADLTGQLTPADLQFIDDDNHRTIVSVDHTAGASTARVSLSSPLDISNDIGVDELAAAAAQIFDNVGIPLQTDKIALSGTVCPIGTVSFQFNEPAGSSTVYDDQGVLAGTVSNPSYAIPGDGYFHGNENMDAYVELTNSAGCLLSIGYTGYLREITLEARIKPEVVDLDYLDADGNGIDDDFDFDKDPFTVLPGGRNSTQQRIFERQKTLQFTIMRGSWAGDYVESRAGKARVMVKYRVPSQYRRDCGAEGAGAWWKQVSSDIDLYPIVAGHWYKIRVVFNSNKSNIPIDIWADHQGANGNGAGENWSGFINIAKPNPEDSGGCKWMSQPGDEILAENKLSYIGDNANHNDMPGASNNQRFKGLIDWLIWKPAADYSGVDSPPH